ARLRQDGTPGQAAARGAGARRARVGAGPRSGARRRGAGDRVPVQRGGAARHGPGDRGGRGTHARFLKNGAANTILRAVTNPLKNNYVVRRAQCAVVAATLAGCGGKQHVEEPAPTAPLPTAGIAAQQVGITPLTLVVAEDSLHWQALLGERRSALTKSDSVIGTLLRTRAPEVTWLLPDELRRAARRAPGIAPDPDQMGTAILLRGGGGREEMVPDPLRNELRTLAALVGAGGGRFVLVPAGLVFRRATTGAGSVGAQHAAPLPRAVATAELTVVMVDVRTGRVGFRTVARGEGDD